MGRQARRWCLIAAVAVAGTFPMHALANDAASQPQPAQQATVSSPRPPQALQSTGAKLPTFVEASSLAPGVPPVVERHVKPAPVLQAPPAPPMVGIRY